MRYTVRLLLVLLFVGSFSVMVAAQEEQTEDTEPTLESVAADSASYYGQEITLEGIIQDYLSPHVFVLGEDALIDNDQVLVINRSGQVFSPQLMQNSRVLVTGTIQPSRDAWEAGDVIEGFEVDGEVGSNNYYGTLSNPEMETETDDEMMMNSFGSFDIDMTSLYYNGRLMEEYDSYTIFVVTSVDAVTMHEPEEE